MPCLTHHLQQTAEVDPKNVVGTPEIVRGRSVEHCRVGPNNLALGLDSARPIVKGLCSVPKTSCAEVGTRTDVGEKVLYVAYQLF